jgi:hypothetical protein
MNEVHVPMQSDSCKKEFTRQKMALHKDVAVLLVQRGIWMEQGEEWREFALPVQEFLVKLQYHGIIWRLDRKGCKARCLY